jgi:hypothetical protein
MVAPSKKTPARKAARVFRVLARRDDGAQTVHSVRAADEADALAKVRVILTDLPDWTVVAVIE